MCGAFGTLGIITQASIKVLPKPEHEITLLFEYDQQQAIKYIQQRLNSLIPITATYFENDHLWIRISGLENIVNTIHKKLGGEKIHSSKTFWQAIKNHQADFFQTDTPLWRCIVPHHANEIMLQGKSCFEWNGGLRWIKSEETAEKVFKTCQTLNGYASLFRSTEKPADCFAPMNNQVKKLHMNLKHAFDPENILNPGRMYSWC